jgi:hypothetical protein
VDESVEYHKKYYTKSVELLSLLKGHREVDFGVGNDEPWDYTDLGESFLVQLKKIGLTSGKKTITLKSTSSTLKKK